MSKRLPTDPRDEEDAYALTDIHSPSNPYAQDTSLHRRSSSIPSYAHHHRSISSSQPYNSSSSSSRSPFSSLPALLGYLIQTQAPILISSAFSLLSSFFLAWLLGYYSTFFVYFIFVAICIPGIVLWDTLSLFGWRRSPTNNGYSTLDYGESGARSSRGWRGDTGRDDDSKLGRVKAQWGIWARSRRWRFRLCVAWTVFMVLAPRYPSSSPLIWSGAPSSSSSIGKDDDGEGRVPGGVPHLDLGTIPKIRASYSSSTSASHLDARGNLTLRAAEDDAPPKKIFIASNLYNSAHLIPTWTSNLKHLIQHLGASNIFVSIYESNSSDRTPTLLGELEEELKAMGVKTRFVTSSSHDAGENGKRAIPPTRPKFSPNSHERIAYMAELRNEAMKPLFELVVWINDVFWDWRSLVHLINTRQGDYDLVCGLDFDGVGMYDTWVMRDACGRPTKEIWPYVASTSNNAGTISNIRHNQPFEVASCWNGLAVFDAGWFLADTPPNSKKPKAKDADAPPFPLRFRDDPEGCTESECYLSSLDLHYWSKPERPSVWVNPSVMSAYTPLQYLFHTRLEQLTLSIPWKIIWQDLIGNVLFGGLVVDRFWGKEDRCGREEGFVKAGWCEDL
ncbi:cryptococcal mannosyltransferase 1-domain-containing protein [Coprinopsis sp. MPI-PUGE-AT-0042]|nr:cryptococcal mannosyltransferase 1-domain-containing protein [Coprinopsis sp. MPI-PUGE-AT-0042]